MVSANKEWIGRHMAKSRSRRAVWPAMAVLVLGACGVFGGPTTIENEKLKVTGEAGKPGLEVSSRQTGRGFTIRLLGEGGTAAGLKAVTAGKADDEDKSMKVTADGGEALVTLGPGQTYVEIKPVKGLNGVAMALIKQQAGLAINASGAGSASLAAKIREECRKVLRNPHPQEHF